MKIQQVILAALILVVVTISPAWGQASTPWVQLEQHDAVQVRLILPGKTDATQNVVNGLLQVKLTESWKTYWRTPGEGGVPPQLAWQDNSYNIEAIDWQFPMPERFSVQGIETVGYQGDVSFPWQIKVTDWQQDTQIAGTLTLASCTDICVISDFPLQLRFNPSQLAADMDAMFLFEQAQSAIPHTEHPFVDVEDMIWSLEQQQLEVRITHKKSWQQPRVFVDSLQPNLTDLTIKQLDQQQTGNTLTARFAISHWLGQPELVGETLQVTVADNTVIAEVSATVGKGSLTPHDSENKSEQQLPSLVLVLGMALLGGLILNVMPCVLPVLGLKLRSIIVAPNQRATIRKHFIASALGIVFSFVLLAVMVMLLKATGHAIGWGIQFQNPYFVGFMVVVTAVFAIAVSGLWRISLPQGLQQWVASRGDNSTLGHFVQGVFATLLATPCTAPFLGTAVAFALAASNLTLLAIFIALGLGMALPWLLVASWPVLANKLPKPGAWLQWVNRVFALLLLLTSLWLLSVLITLLTPNETAEHVQSDTQQALWQPLNGQAIAAALADNKVVFVDVTADWCVTCQANKYNVLTQQPVAGALQQPNVVALRGDWTRPNQRITDFLQANGRFGVPFNQVYGPAAPEGLILPVILTDQAVLQAIEQASGAARGVHETD